MSDVTHLVNCKIIVSGGKLFQPPAGSVKIFFTARDVNTFVCVENIYESTHGDDDFSYDN